jgi:hypothetical protein
MKRTSQSLSDPSHVRSTLKQFANHLPTQWRGDSTPLDEDSAGELAALLLNQRPPQQDRLERLLDAMHEQGIRTFKLSGARLDAVACQALTRLFTERFRLRDQIREIDFSDTQFECGMPLLWTISRHKPGQLVSLKLENTVFGDSVKHWEAHPDQDTWPQHVQAILQIVEGNTDLKRLNLNGQAFMGSEKGRRSPRHFSRNAPIHRLMELMQKSGIESLSLRNCGLSELDLDDIAMTLSLRRRSSSPSRLRELELQDNDPKGTYAYPSFLRQLNQHPSLERLGLPEHAHAQYQRLTEEEQRRIAQDVLACPRLKHLEPDGLANAPHICPELLRRSAEGRFALLANAVLSIQTVSPPTCLDNLAQVMSYVARLEHLEPAQVLPARLVHQPASQNGSPAR